MLPAFPKRVVARTVLALVMAFTGAPAFAETKVGSVVDSRTMLGFKIDDAALEDLLPGGWDSFTLPQGPIAGANLIVALIDRHIILDGAGAPENPASGPIVVLLAYARKNGAKDVRAFVIRVYEEPPLVDPYGNSVPADVDRHAAYRDAGGGDRVQSEVWTVRTRTGGELKLDLEHRLGELQWSTGVESRPFSAQTPDAFRIFRYDQLTGLAMSTAMGKALEGRISFSVNDPALEAVFDGREVLVSVLQVPIQIREVFSQ